MTQRKTDTPKKSNAFMQKRSSEDESMWFFQRIEECFLALRGKPMLLSPRDWVVAEAWHADGIDLELIESTLRDVFERRAERGATASVSSLQYVDGAVRKAWAEMRELGAANTRPPVAVPRMDLANTLARIASLLPSELWHRATWYDKILALEQLPSPEEVEQALQQVGRDILRDAEKRLELAERAAIEASVERALERVATRLSSDELGKARSRLFDQTLRAHLGLPRFSVFS